MKDIIQMDITIEEFIADIQTKYHAKVERPWGTNPEHTTFKDPELDKWFMLLMHLPGKTLGLKDVEDLWVINVKAETDFIMMSSSIPGYMPGYHMNKKHWLTVFLDGSVPMDQVYDCIHRSYVMVTDTPSKRIYEAVKRIPKGRVATYGQVAAMAGDAKMARAVGNALHHNPSPETVPCYRVVNGKGQLSGAFAFGGENAQANLLMADGIEVIDGKVDLSKYGIEAVDGKVDLSKCGTVSNG